jgi:hypothetical protein
MGVSRTRMMPAPGSLIDFARHAGMSDPHAIAAGPDERAHDGYASNMRAQPGPFWVGTGVPRTSRPSTVESHAPGTPARALLWTFWE